MAQKAKFRPIPVTLKSVDHADIDSREKKAETSHGKLNLAFINKLGHCNLTKRYLISYKLNLQVTNL